MKERKKRMHPKDLAELGKIIADELKQSMPFSSQENISTHIISYSAEEAAKLLDVSTDTIFRWCRNNVIHSFKIGGKRRISQQTLIDYQNGKTK